MLFEVVCLLSLKYLDKKAHNIAHIYLKIRYNNDMSIPKVSLDQWRALQAVVDNGGYAQAASKLNRSQSSVSYAIHRIEDQLGLQVLEVRGRKAQLTEAGEMILQRGRDLVQAASELEDIAQQINSGWEPRLQLVVDAAFPTGLLMQALQQFSSQSRGTVIDLHEVVLSGADDLLAAGDADLVIGHQLPAGHLGDEIIRIPFVAVAHPQHPLAALESISETQLSKHRQLIVSDSGLHNKQDKGWLGAEQRWSVSSLDAALTMTLNNMGFTWLPVHKIADLLQQQRLVQLPLLSGQRYTALLYLFSGHKTHQGPAASILSQLLRDVATQYNSGGDY